MQLRQEGSPVNLVLADHNTAWMMEVASDFGNHPNVKVIGFAQSGQAALDRVVSMAADAVLMEYGLPDLTASEVAQSLAKDAPGTAIFAVASSNSISMQLVQSAKAMGVVEIFPKESFVAREVAERITEHVDGLRREWSRVAQKHGLVEKGTGPRGQVVQKEYVTTTLTQSVILTHNTKGGVGKSTIAVNLAVAIKRSPLYSGQRVALVDFDTAGANVATICHLNESDAYGRNISIWEQVPEDLSPKEVDDLLLPGPAGVMVCAAPLNLAMGRRVTVDLADKVLRILRRYYGTIVIDGAPNISDPIDAAMHHATHILLIANPEGQSVRQLGRIVQLVSPDPNNLAKADLSHLLRKMFVVINHAHSDSKWNLRAGDIATAIGRPVLAEIPNDEVVKQALHSTNKKQAVEINDESPFAFQIKRLVNDICSGAYPEAIVGQPKLKKASGGGFSDIFSRVFRRSQ
ncbi:MAG: nucleotide-binding protein [Bacillota bacterium]